ncbi:MAG: Uma2 family endonuclease [Anaerolineae bacterium]|nr:Uma2 family endonuclease [Anaerolineae bacterium]
MAVRKRLFTVSEFEALMNLPENADLRFELIDGEIIQVPSNPYSSAIAALIIIALGVFIRGKNLGHITGEQGGYMVAGARLAPDVAYISKKRQQALVRQGYNPVAPDLVVEVVSPSDDPDVLSDKLKKYAEAGVIVWVVYPKRSEVEVFAPGQPARTLGIDDMLTGGDVLPGFALPVRDIFPEE